MSVAVVTTCFNEERWIDDAIRSVLEQTCYPKPRQHIIVNDGSTDGSAELLAGYPHLELLTVTNRGMAAARNAGLLALAPEVEWVVFLDGDDWLEPNFIEECLRQSDEADVVWPGRRKHPGPTSPSLPAVLHPTEAQLWERCYGTSCAMVRRSLMIEVGGFHPGVAGDCDWDLWIDCARRGARFGYATGTHYHYRVRPDSHARTVAPRLRPANMAEMRRHHLCA